MAHQKAARPASGDLASAPDDVTGASIPENSHRQLRVLVHDSKAVTIAKRQLASAACRSIGRDRTNELLQEASHGVKGVCQRPLLWVGG